MTFDVPRRGSGVVTSWSSRSPDAEKPAAAAAATIALLDQIVEVIDEVKPRLRGWLHLSAVPLTLAAGVLLVGLSPPGTPRAGSVVFAACALILFSVSAALHRGKWSPSVGRVMTRLDHACIFLLIAGTYTPVGLLLLDGSDRVILLAVVWGGAGLGITFRLMWTQAPRALSTSVYLALGSVAIFFAGDLARHASTAAMTLLVLGGVLYAFGALVHGLRRPNPIPEWFGFHEVFHTLTVVAFAAHYTAVSITTYTLR
jgi:hemolysin III